MVIGDVNEAVHKDPNRHRPCAYPSPIISLEEAADRPNALPIFDSKIAARNVSKEQWLQDCQHAELPEHFTTKPGLFVVLILEGSMNRSISNGPWCLSCELSDGSRNLKFVIFPGRCIQALDNGGQHTMKIYRSDKNKTKDSWSHRWICLEPDSMDLKFKLISIKPDSVNDLRVVEEFLGIIH